MYICIYICNYTRVQSFVADWKHAAEQAESANDVEKFKAAIAKTESDGKSFAKSSRNMQDVKTANAELKQFISDFSIEKELRILENVPVLAIA